LASTGHAPQPPSSTSSASQWAYFMLYTSHPGSPKLVASLDSANRTNDRPPNLPLPMSLVKAARDLESVRSSHGGAHPHIRGRTVPMSPPTLGLVKSHILLYTFPS
jgi:hypothetical protein